MYLFRLNEIQLRLSNLPVCQDRQLIELIRSKSCTFRQTIRLLGPKLYTLRFEHVLGTFSTILLSNWSTWTAQSITEHALSTVQQRAYSAKQKNQFSDCLTCFNCVRYQMGDKACSMVDLTFRHWHLDGWKWNAGSTRNGASCHVICIFRVEISRVWKFSASF